MNKKLMKKNFNNWMMALMYSLPTMIVSLITLVLTLFYAMNDLMAAALITVLVSSLFAGVSTMIFFMSYIGLSIDSMIKGEL